MQLVVFGTEFFEYKKMYHIHKMQHKNVKVLHGDEVETESRPDEPVPNTGRVCANGRKKTMSHICAHKMHKCQLRKKRKYSYGADDEPSEDRPRPLEDPPIEPTRNTTEPTRNTTEPSEDHQPIEQATYQRQRKKSTCPHGRDKQYCKQCGGSGLCEHGRNKRECKECGGSGICEHGKIRRACKECLGIKMSCSTCKTSTQQQISTQQQQPNQNVKKNNPFCEHGREKYSCKECGGAGI